MVQNTKGPRLKGPVSVIEMVRKIVVELSVFVVKKYQVLLDFYFEFKFAVAVGTVPDTASYIRG
jgi:hypothetical protein